ncbi:unnamed protein product [Heligmosomoides polygyrus]|uniref:DUF1653 domain-containing protein n=1 Tax=Heligmosomoides polygyrus TaxID=6339 RepID=A0A183GMC5_HELPZ|nr:unnamed protein product [Heligmosomoides polygyrus]
MYHRIGAFRPLAGNAPQCTQRLIATANEVAVVYVGNDEEIPGERYVVVYERGQGLCTISYLDRL